MLKKIAIAFCAMFLLSGCCSKSNYNRHVTKFANEIGDRVFFGFDSAKLSNDSMAVLTRQADWLKEHKKFAITVEGHCDERGTREYNIALGERRAESVKRFLVKHGVDSARIETISYGKERPAVLGNNKAAWDQNRRGVTVIK